MTRVINQASENLIKGFEAYRPVPYWDGSAAWTDGWGNTHGVVPHGPAITLGKAQADFDRNIAGACAAVSKLVAVHLTDNEFGALVSFVFNVGETNFAKSTLLRVLNAGGYTRVPAELAKYRFSAGKELAGLVRRRAAEAALFMTDEVPAPAAIKAVTKPAKITPAHIAGAATVAAGTAAQAIHTSSAVHLAIAVVVVLGLGVSAFLAYRHFHKA